MSQSFSRLFFLYLIFVLLIPFQSATTAPAEFSVETVVSGLEVPTQVAFAPDGRIFIAEKSGTVRIVKNGHLLSKPFLVLTDVNSVADHGLIGLTLDPDFSANGWVYLSYTFENTPGKNYNDPKTGRIVRVKANGDEADMSTYTVLVGSIGGDESKPSCSYFPVTSDCIPSDSPSHSVGGLRFGPDGKLYAALGDGAGYFEVDPKAHAAQDLDALSGKILRLNPDGTAPIDNPFYTGNPHDNRSKVFAYGFRNPFRMNFRPDNGALFLGDVGWFMTEEINVIAPGGNYGWPCQEGYSPTPGYNCSVANAIDPIYTFDHEGEGVYAIVGGAFAGGYYPSEYQNNYFFGDYGSSNIRRMILDENNQPLIVEENFINEHDGPVDFIIGPDGAIYYLSIYFGQLKRITYGLPQIPVIMASVTPENGTAPLETVFSSEGTYDPVGGSLTYQWDFGDGNQSTEKDAFHTYNVPGEYRIVFTVSNGQGRTATKIFTVNVASGGQSEQPADLEYISSTKSSEQIFVGDIVTFNTAVKNIGSDGRGIVDLELYNSSGQLQQTFYETYLLEQETKEFGLTWQASEPGTYWLSVGLFGPEWNGIQAWVDKSVSFSVLNRNPTSTELFVPIFKNISVAENVSLSETVPIETSIQADSGSGQVIVDVEITKDGQQTDQFFESLSLQSEAPSVYQVNWTPVDAGTYQISVGIFDETWGTLYKWIHNAKTVTVGSLGSGGESVVYGDVLGSGWENWSWDTNLTLDDPSVVHEGNAAMKIDYNSSWSGLYFHHNGFGFSDYSMLTLWLHGGATGGQKLQFIPYQSGNALSPIDLSPFLIDGMGKANEWQKISIPLNSLNLSGDILDGLVIQGLNGYKQPIFYLDDVMFE